MSWLVISEIARNFGIVIAGAVGICLAWRRVAAATRQADASLQEAALSRRSHVAELFNRAVGQLTDSKLEVRLGAIYTSRQIARDFSDLADPTFQLLTAYLRESVPSYEGEPPVDVREIISILQEPSVKR